MFEPCHCLHNTKHAGNQPSGIHIQMRTHSLTVLFKSPRILKFKSQLTFALCAAVNNFRELVGNRDACFRCLHVSLVSCSSWRLQSKLLPKLRNSYEALRTSARNAVLKKASKTETSLPAPALQMQSQHGKLHHDNNMRLIRTAKTKSLTG